MRRLAVTLASVLLCGWVAASAGAEELDWQDDFPLSLLDADQEAEDRISPSGWEEEAPVADPYYDSCDAGCDASCCCGECCRPVWTVAAEALFLQRSSLDDDETPVGPNWGIVFDTDAGWRLTARRRLRCGMDLDFSYMSLDTLGMSPPLGPPGLPYTIEVRVPRVLPDGTVVWESRLMTVTSPFRQTYSSDLDSAEINLRRPVGCYRHVSVGFRWLGLDESLTERDANSVHYDGIGTENDLYGFQLGTDALLLSCCEGRLECRGGLKAGIYYNRTAQRITAPYSFAAGSDSDTAFCGELTVTGAYRLTDCLAVRAGYQLLWLSGVALASEQPPIDVPSQFPVDADGDLFYHGALVGLEYRR